jgi:hypothetical protein
MGSISMRSSALRIDANQGEPSSDKLEDPVIMCGVRDFSPSKIDQSFQSRTTNTSVQIIQNQINMQCELQQDNSPDVSKSDSSEKVDMIDEVIGSSSCGLGLPLK